MSGDFEGKVALITGAGGDLGGAAAVLLAERGAKVVAVDRNAAGLEALKGRMPAGSELLGVTADVSSESETAGYVDRAAKAFGRIDVFFNNAGIEGSRTGGWRPLVDLPLADFKEIIAVNARGVFLGLKHVIPVMAQGGGGAIVNTSSINGLRAARNQLAYVASKHAVRSMTVTAAKEWAARNIRVNAVAPGGIQGRMLRDFGAIIREWAPPPDPSRPPRYNPPPIARLADPREIARVVLFLASDEASYITGACYAVDGGLSANY
jgi:NAD(P)-dependent dehydrogenase (short-subunit alcohol dehydrogenase family)